MAAEFSELIEYLKRFQPPRQDASAADVVLISRPETAEEAEFRARLAQRLTTFRDEMRTQHLEKVPNLQCRHMKHFIQSVTDVLQHVDNMPLALVTELVYMLTQMAPMLAFAELPREMAGDGPIAFVRKLLPECKHMLRLWQHNLTVLLNDVGVPLVGSSEVYEHLRTCVQSKPYERRFEELVLTPSRREDMIATFKAMVSMTAWCNINWILKQLTEGQLLVRLNPGTHEWIVVWRFTPFGAERGVCKTLVHASAEDGTAALEQVYKATYHLNPREAV